MGRWGFRGWKEAGKQEQLGQVKTGFLCREDSEMTPDLGLAQVL